MTHDDVEEPVELYGFDGTRIRRRAGAQRLTLDRRGMRMTRRGRAVETTWRGIVGIERYPMALRYSTAKAWAIIGRDGTIIFPHEFDEQWTAGPIGDRLRHHRPDLDLPDPETLKVLPFGIPNHQVPYVFLPAVVVGIVVLTVFFGSSVVTAALLVAVCVGGVLLWVASPKWQRIPRYASYVVSGIAVIVALGAWLWDLAR